MPGNTSPFLVVGLGNPGSRYERTQHNVGFAVIDVLAQRWKADKFQSKFQSQLAAAMVGDRKVLLLKPQTYMNLSGQAVQEAAQFYKIAAEDGILVISDDLDLPRGRLRLRPSGGSGGHNGLKSVIECLGSEGFARLRVGIGRGENMDSKSYVLSKINKADSAAFEEAVWQAAECVEMFLKEGVLRTQEKYNRRASEKKEDGKGDEK